MSIVFWGLNILLSSLCCLLLSRKLVHIYQLENYQLAGLYRSVKRDIEHIILPHFLISLTAWGGHIAGLPLLLCLLIQTLLSYLYYKAIEKQKEKKAFRRTERIIRFGIVHLLIGILASIVFSRLVGHALLILPAFELIVFTISALAAIPIEKSIARQFINDAKRRLQNMPSMKVIGITGSFGKTSTKFILQSILSVRWKVLATPGSFNTTMGVTRVIREMLTPGFDVFITEMGARHRGDIKELVDLVKPVIGMITAVGPQHLDTFGTVENVAKAKYELIEGLPSEGLAFFANDNGICKKLFDNCDLKNKYLCGDLLKVEQVHISPSGTAFILRDTISEDCVKCSTKLLGEHAISNILLCATVAYKLGLTLNEISKGIANCNPIEHRLQLITHGNGVTIIDDAFNSNPSGAEAALNVLGQFEGRRIIVTPGMVELGKEQDSYNERFGKQIAKNADIAIVVGKQNADSITKGILGEDSFDINYLYTVNTLDEGTRVLQNILKTGDVVLYENDLPDNYS